MRKSISIASMFIVIFAAIAGEAGPTLSAGYVENVATQDHCANVATAIIEEYVDYTITRTEAGNVLAKSEEYTILVLCYPGRISVSVAGYGSRQATHAISENVRNKLVQRL